MRDRSHVVEELGIDRPLLVFLPDRTADDLRAKLRDNIAQQKTFSIMNDRAESFVDCAIVISSFSCRTEPSLVDSTSVKSECIQIIWMKFQSLARLQKRSWNPRRRKSQYSIASVKRRACCFLHIFCDALCGTSCHNCKFSGCRCAATIQVVIYLFAKEASSIFIAEQQEFQALSWESLMPFS